MNRSIKIMGVLNITPDSFSDGGLFLDEKKAFERIEQMQQQGADIIDIGAESSRPGATPMSSEEEMKRLKPIFKRIKKGTTCPISLDTYKPDVAKMGLDYGVQIINDITGLRDPKMAQLIGQYQATVVIMHMKKTPKTMQEAPCYEDVIEEISTWFDQQINVAKQHKIKSIILDPGIGFGKAAEHNLRILNRLSQFKNKGCPLLVGASRKSFIGQITGASVTQRLAGTLAAHHMAYINGADILRVHDIIDHKQSLKILKAINNESILSGSRI